MAEIEKNKLRDKDFERLSAYAEALNEKYSRTEAQDYDFEQVLSTEKPDVYFNEENFDDTKEISNHVVNEPEELKFDEDFATVSNSTYRWDSFKEKKYLLSLIPVFFLALFLLAGEQSHKGVIKSSAFTYTGQILDDAPNGKGVMTYQNGDSYDGDFKAGKFSGTGTFVSKAGKWTFVGTFENGLANGKGTMTMPDGTKNVKTYKNGVLTR